MDQQLKDLNAQFEAEVAALDNKVDPTTEVFETIINRPKKAGINVQLVGVGLEAGIAFYCSCLGPQARFSLTESAKSL